MWITDGERYVNLDNVSKLSIEKDSQGDTRLLVDGKPEFDLDVAPDKASFEKLMIEGSGPYAKKVVHLVDRGLITRSSHASTSLTDRWGGKRISE